MFSKGWDIFHSSDRQTLKRLVTTKTEKNRGLLMLSGKASFGEKLTIASAIWNK